MIPTMRMPFGRLMELVAAALDREGDVTLGELAGRWDETPQRIADAIDAVKVLNGEPSYIEVTAQALSCAHLAAVQAADRSR